MSLYRIVRTVVSTLVVCLAVMVSVSLAQGITRPKQGQGGSVVQGARKTMSCSGSVDTACDPRFR